MNGIMIKILLCCGGGFSSSYVANRVKKEIEDYHMEQEVYIEFSPFSLMLEKYKQFDIVVCCPHLNIYVKQLLEKQKLDIPIYILPPRMYGNMKLKEIYQDAKDLLDIYAQTKMNPVHFPSEDNVLKITRDKAYKNSFEK